MASPPLRRPRTVPSLVALIACGLAFGEPASPAPTGDLDDGTLHGLRFRMVGPFRGGRSTTVTGHPDLPFTFYMGTTGGGVWRTTNAGGDWENISDGFLTSASVGSVEVAPSDPNVLYVGTGSGCPRGNIMNGDGIYRSVDAGETWSHVGLPDAGLVPRIVVHPDDPDRLWVAVLGDIFEPGEERGVYHSRDGGTTWERVHFVSERTGAVDIAIDPFNPRVLWAAMWTAERKPWTFVDGGEESGLWKSTDGGATWRRLESGLPSGPLGRIGLAASPARRGRIWVHVTAPIGEGGIYRSDDGGESFDLVNGERSLQVRGWYYSHVEADPVDPDTVYSIGLRFHRSVDGGRTFRPIPTPHGDNHDLWIHPRRPEVMVEANDGGATVTLDAGASWSTLHNQPTAELYRLTVDDGFPYRLYGAQQDNSSISVPAWSTGGFAHEQDWEMPGGGESGHIAVHPDRPEIVYSGNYIGLLERWDRDTGERRGVLLYPELADGVPPRDLTYRFQWNAPIRLSPHDPGRLYHASHRIHRSTDDGMSWQTLTGDLSRDDEEKQELPGGPIQFDDTGVEVYGTVFAFEESPLVRGELWAGTDDGRVHLSRDDGATWEEITPADMAEDTTVNTIELSPTVEGRAYLAAHRYRLGDDAPLIWRTDDRGRSWERLDEGIAAGHFVRVVREHPSDPDLLAAGTERGLYFSFDGGARWQQLQLGLPVAQVADLAFAHGGLSVATHGRSFWVLDDVTPLLQLSSLEDDAALQLLPPAEAVRGLSGGRYSDGPQPDRREGGAALFLWLADGVAGEGVLQVRDAGGDVVRESVLVAGDELPPGERDGFVLEPGLNRVVWDLRDERPETLDGAVMSLGYTGANVVPPGRYTVRVEFTESADGDGDTASVGASAAQEEPGNETLTVESELVVATDPRFGSDADGARAAYDLASRVRDRMVEIHRTVAAIRDLRAQVEATSGRLEEAGERSPARYGDLRSAWEERRTGVLDDLRELEEELIQTRSEAPQDPLNFPPRLDNQYAFLYGQLVGLDGRPNEGSYQRLEDLDARWQPLAARWDELVAGPVRELDGLLREAEVGGLLVLPVGSP